VPATRPYSPLDESVQYLKGVGPRRAEALARLGIRSGRDLLFHIPRRYEDASTVTPIARAEIGQDVTLIGEVTSKGVIPTRSGLRIFEAMLRDETGMIECAWPGQVYLDRVIRRGDVLLVTGPVRFFHGRQIQPREYVILGHAGEDSELGGKVLPIYPATEGLSHRLIRSILEANLDTLLARIAGEEMFTPAMLAEAGVPPLAEALEAVHRPTSIAAAERGRRRLAYEEIFFLQLLHARAHHQATAAREGLAFRRTNALIGELYRRLPFTLTGAQTRAIREIFADMESPRRMNRLVQGDVGSGKTVVALFAMLLAAESGYQAALMAPTEILAEQHARTLRRLLAGLPVEVALLTGRLSTAERRAALEAISSGRAQLVVGTHALIQEGVRFARLGLAVIDEQHRFGVRQRMALAELGERPDVLVMSATPIPRSLAMALYGDLDLTVLDELPRDRKPIRTAVRSEKSRERVYAFIRDQVREGRQAYVVYPLVEESEKLELRAATEEYERLANTVFPDLRVGLVHGQMAGEEKDATMRAFMAGELDILVSTTVIEVGIDVPNATVMLIEHAERFGLSQLHQLRGRVGRGAQESYCILITGGGEEATRRLRIIAQTDDGFEIARQDLALRGMGDLFGARQHGLPEFRYFRPEADDDLLRIAHMRTRAIVAQDPALALPEHRPLAEALVRRYGERAKMYEAG